MTDVKGSRKHGNTFEMENHGLFFTHKTVRSYGVAQYDYEEIL